MLIHLHIFLNLSLVRLEYLDTEIFPISLDRQYFLTPTGHSLNNILLNILLNFYSKKIAVIISIFLICLLIRPWIGDNTQLPTIDITLTKLTDLPYQTNEFTLHCSLKLIILALVSWV